MIVLPCILTAVVDRYDSIAMYLNSHGGVVVDRYVVLPCTLTAVVDRYDSIAMYLNSRGGQV